VYARGVARKRAQGEVPEALATWADNQRALARTLGLSIEEWLAMLEAASKRSMSLTAAVIGAAKAKGLGMSVLSGLDGPALGARARALIDPRPPRVENPLLKEAIRRAGELGAEGAGARRLKRPKRKDSLPTPERETKPLGQSAGVAAPDAPGEGPPVVRAAVVRQPMGGDLSESTGLSSITGLSDITGLSNVTPAPAVPPPEEPDKGEKK
jgi:hypothetical protein